MTGGDDRVITEAISLMTVCPVRIWGYLMVEVLAGNADDSEKVSVWCCGWFIWTDTLRATDGDQEFKIQLCGIDALEKDQPMGVESRDHLQELIDQG
jgi:hypothetical protein